MKRIVLSVLLLGCLFGCGLAEESAACREDPQCENLRCTEPLIWSGEACEPCERGTVFDDGFCLDAVDYDRECASVRCYSPDENSEFESGSFQSFSCRWECARHEGRSQRWVEITFSRNGSECWTESVFEADGVCF